MHELILGGNKSGKSRYAEQRAVAWLTKSGRYVVQVVTALAGVAEMHARIQRYGDNRAVWLPGLPLVVKGLDA